MAKTFFILAGEASGDLHGGKLITALKELEPTARFVGMGGAHMAAAGLEVAKDLEGMQVVGFWEVAKHYGFFKDVFHRLLDRVKQERPAALICIDYPGFNLRFAKEVRKLGIPTIYYIVPQVWAWKPGRAARMAEYIDRAYCVFEFEPPFFEKFSNSQRRMKTEFVGHPLLDQPSGNGKMEPLPGEGRTVGLLAGSRPGEFAALGAPLGKGFGLAAEKQRDLRALMSIPSGVSGQDCRNVLAWLNGGASGNAPSGMGEPERKLEERRLLFAPYAEEKRCLDALASRERAGISHARLIARVSDFSIIKSGTSTLEAGLQGKPMSVVYRGGWLSYTIARMLVDIPVFSLVNIVLGRYAVPELLQGEVTPKRIAQEIDRGLNDQGFREKQQALLTELPGKLGGPGASSRTAKGILNFLNGKG